jgi:hypothetical protein
MTKKMVEPAYKYAVYPGWCKDRSGNNEYYISFPELCHRYGVDPEECMMVIEPPSPKHPTLDTEGLIELRPRRDGNYERLA